MVETRALYDAILTDRLTSPTIKTATSLHKVMPRSNPAATKPVDELPFTGRNAELATLQQLMQSYPVVLIEGESGVARRAWRRSSCAVRRGWHWWAAS